MRIQFLNQEYFLEEAMAAHSSILAWRITCTEESGELQSTGSQRVGPKYYFAIKSNEVLTHGTTHIYLKTCLKKNQSQRSHII